MLPEEPTNRRRFPKVLEALVASRIEARTYRNKASAARALGISHPRLASLLSGSVIAGSKTVAQICSKLDKMSASKLLQAYLLDERDTVIRTAKKTGKPKWDIHVSVELAK